MISKEYATYFSIAKELEVHESTIYRIVKKTEDILIQSGKFALPGKIKTLKALAERYRNRRKRFGLRFNLVAGLCNWELGNEN